MEKIKSLAKRLLILGQKTRHLRKPRKKPIILTYHSVGNFQWNLSVPAVRFEKHLLFLKEETTFEIVSLQDLLSELESNKNMGRKVAITFDDGHYDNFSVARPILNKYGIKATFFITTDFIEGKIPPGFGATTPKKSMSWQEVRKLRAEGHEIGSHCKSHIGLNNLSNSKLKEEIVESKEIIESQLGGEINSIAYPFGEASENAREMANETYKYCFSVGSGATSDIYSDLSNIKRVPINNRPMWDFENVVKGYYDWVVKLDNLATNAKLKE